jgi:uncharacterized protein (UPF0147 family)
VVSKREMATQYSQAQIDAVVQDETIPANVRHMVASLHAAVQVKWMRHALDVAMRETALYRRTAMTGRCIP